MKQGKIVLPIFAIFLQLFLSSSVLAQPVTDSDSHEQITTTREFSSSENEYSFEDDPELHHYIQFLQSVDEEQIEEVAKIIRGQSEAQANCVHLAKAMIQYFKTGKAPSKSVSEKDCDLGDYRVELFTGSPGVQTKREISDSFSSTSCKIPRSVKMIINSAIQNPGSFEEDMPPDIHEINILEGDSFTQESLFDFTQYFQPKIQHSNLAEKLKELAAQQELVQVSFGKINLGRIVRNQQIELGHMLVYFASPKEVLYIDLQKINRGVGKGVHHSLEEIVTFYSESAKRRSGADLFDPTGFYVPLGPKLDSRIHRQKKIKIEPSDPSEHSKISSVPFSDIISPEVPLEFQENVQSSPPFQINPERIDPAQSELPLKVCWSVKVLEEEDFQKAFGTGVDDQNVTHLELILDDCTYNPRWLSHLPKNLQSLKLVIYSIENFNKDSLFSQMQMEALRHLRSLKQLNLIGSFIRAKGVQALAQSENFCSLTTLNLGRNSLGDEGSEALAHSENLCSLRKLYLSDTKIGDEGLKSLAGSENFRSLITLTLDLNKIGDEGLKFLAQPEHFCSLTKLSLCQNKIGTKGLSA